MLRSLLNEYAAVPQPSQGQEMFIESLKAAAKEYFSEDEKCPGVALSFVNESAVPETAMISLRRVLAAKGIQESPQGKSVEFILVPDWEAEEFEVTASEEKVTLSAADREGLRRAVYFLRTASESAAAPCAPSVRGTAKLR